MLVLADQSLFLQSLDPDLEPNYQLDVNHEKVRRGNTGFMVFRNTPRTKEVIQQWLDCPKKIPDCQPYTYTGLHEQHVFAHWIRPTLAPGELVLIPCNDANSYPNGNPTFTGDCVGKYINHYWSDKGAAKLRLEEIVKQEVRTLLMMQLVQPGGLQKLTY